MPRIVAVQGPLRGTAYEVHAGASIGRSRDCAVRLEGSHISRVHARFEPRGDSLALVDADSRNGIFVNSQRVREHVLAKDDEIEIGEHVFVFEPSFDVEISSKSGAKASETSVRDSIVSPFAALALDRLQAVVEAARALLPIEEDKDLAKAMLERLMAAARAWRGFVAVAGRGGRMKPLAREARGEDCSFRVGNVIYQQVHRERRAVIATDVVAAGPQKGKPISILAVPLVTGEKAIGFAYLDAPAEGTPPAPSFTRSDLQFAAAFCALAAPIVGAARRASRARNALNNVLKRLNEESPIVTSGGLMKEAADRIGELAGGDGPVLLLGEPGTGRHYLAQAIHRRSSRGGHGFVTVHCATLAAAEGALFSGRKAGGLIEAPRGGTVFLSEVAGLPLSLQEKLEHVLDERAKESGDEPDHGVRIMASSSADLAELTGEGKFRTGLLSKLGTTVKLPPLRERKGDVPLLVAHFLKAWGGRPDAMTPEALAFLEGHRWPGNVRELRNAVERMLMNAGAQRIGVEHIPSDLKAKA